MTGDHDDATTPGKAPSGPPRLQAVRGPLVGQVQPPAVRLWREWKGVTVADLQRDEFVARLPGQVQSALRHLERGDLRAADAALPGDFAPVLPGPGAVRSRHRLVVALVAVAAVLAAVLFVAWMES